MKLFLRSSSPKDGEGRPVSVVSVMEAICVAMIKAEPGEGPACIFPAVSFTIESHDDSGTRVFVADSKVEANLVISAQLQLRSNLMDYRGRRGPLTISNHFQLSYGYLSPDSVERIGLEELMLREAMCVGVAIKDVQHRRLVFALDVKDVVPVLELFHEGAGRVQVPTILRDLAVTLNSASL